ncbi:hypothetical protein L3X38_043001 [Prunus dulcis]|uniref:Uncharacterized protein n=1 Tax=Prunus dulcis TaxID=3755 RepID=A0AAD4YLU4_PRUDU|nr:hypothetical protein L3X38_043001 [Prunus dulcis]
MCREYLTRARKPGHTLVKSPPKGNHPNTPPKELYVCPDESQDLTIRRQHGKGAYGGFQNYILKSITSVHSFHSSGGGERDGDEDGGERGGDVVVVVGMMVVEVEVEEEMVVGMAIVEVEVEVVEMEEEEVVVVVVEQQQ